MKGFCGAAAWAAAVVLSCSLWAQTPTGAIEGTVTDQTGAVVPNAKVTITETATSRTIPLSTNTIGYYAARNLPPGTYNVKVEAPGFAEKDINGIVVNSGAVVNASASLEVGRTGEVVEVEAQAIAVDTSRQTVDSVVNEAEIKNLPLFSRNFLDLAALAPGVVIRDGGAIDPTKTFAYRAVSVAGSSGTGTRVQIDGIDVTDETVGTTTSNISDEAVSQFQLTRSSLDISTSLTSTGAINVITKSGTNALHGSGFYDFYNQDLGARLQYNPTSEPFNRKRFGVSLGGPVIKDKLFFFGNFERTYQNSQAVFDSGDFPQLNVSQGFPTGLRYGIGRMDWNITSTMRAFYKFQHNWDISTGGSPVSPFQNIDWTNSHTVGLDWAKSRASNTFRYGYVNFNNNIESQELTKKFPNFNGTQYFLGVGSFQAGPNGLAPQATYQDNYQMSYDGSFILGRHTLRYGASFTHIKLGGFANFAGPLTVSGTYDAGTLAAVKAAGLDIHDPLNYPFESFSMGPANGFFTLKGCHNLPHGCHINNRTGIFGGDSIKVTRNLTLNFGLRWEYDSGFFPNDPNVHREPLLERYGKGYSLSPQAPKDMFSPSFGFAWDPFGTGKTSIRGGFYKAYEANIFNNILFDEYAMLPAGIGPDVYDNTGVFGPDGNPIVVAGHTDGDYSDLVGQPIKSVLPTIVQVNSALQAAYANYKFDPSKGDSAFKTARGNTFGFQIPGNQLKVPYALQFNLGVQRELRPGTVISVDYIFNHGVGLPYMGVDFEHRRAANTLNVAAARTKINSVLKGATVDEYIAANPKATIANFGLASDTIFTGLFPDITRARLFQGGFTKYRALQVNLSGRAGTFLKLRDTQYTLSYSFGRAEASAASGRAEFLTNAPNEFNQNDPRTFGPTARDFRHVFTAGAVLNVPGGFQVNSLWRFQSAQPYNVTIPNLGGAISGANGIFGTDLEGDGGTGTTPNADPLPGVNYGQFGRDVANFKELNQKIQAFNQNYAGKLTPHGQALVSAGLFTEAQLRALGAVIKPIPLIPDNAPNPFHNLFTTDVRLSRPVKFREKWSITPFFDVFNLFNHAPPAGYGGLSARFGSWNYDYAAAPPGSQASDLNAQRLRLNDTRQMQFGVRVDF